MGGFFALPQKKLLPQFAGLTGQGTARQNYVPGQVWAENPTLVPVGWPALEPHVGVACFGAYMKFTNLHVKTWEGATLLFDDFADDAVDAFPAARWGQWDAAAGSDWRVQSDASAPSASKKVMQNTSGGNDWAWLWPLAEALSGLRQFVVEVDICMLPTGTNFFGLAWYLKPGVLGGDAPEAYYWAQDRTTYHALRRSTTADPHTPIFVRTRQSAPIEAHWYKLRVVVDDCNFRCYGSHGETSTVISMWHQINSYRAIVFDSFIDSTGDAGSVEGMWVTGSNAILPQPTVNMYFDGAAIARISVPLREFLWGDFVDVSGDMLYSDAPYMTRYHGSNIPLRAAWRYIHIPWDERLVIEVVNESAIDTAGMFMQVWHRTGKSPAIYPIYTPKRHKGDYTEHQWATLAEVSGEGILHGLLVGVMGSPLALEGNLRIWVDDEPVWESAGAEDAPLNSFYFTGGAIFGDNVGVPVYRAEVPGVSPSYSMFYRRFIDDSIIFKQSLKVELQNGQEWEGNPPGTTVMRAFCDVYTR